MFESAIAAVKLYAWNKIIMRSLSIGLWTLGCCLDLQTWFHIPQISVSLPDIMGVLRPKAWKTKLIVSLLATCCLAFTLGPWRAKFALTPQAHCAWRAQCSRPWKGRMKGGGTALTCGLSSPPLLPPSRAQCSHLFSSPAWCPTQLTSNLNP